jgi:hypothetical protein
LRKSQSRRFRPPLPAELIDAAAASDTTLVTLHVSITEIGPKAKLAAFGMKWGYKSQLDALEKHLTG